MALFFIDKKGAETAPNVPLGNIVALISGIFFGLYILAIRHHRSLQKNPAISVLYGNLIVVLVMLPFVFTDPPQTLTIKDIVAISFLGIVQIGIAYILFTNGIAAGVRSLDASIIGFIEPLFNPIWVLVFLGETPAGWAIAGGIIILATVAIHTIVNSRHGVRAAS
jgi:drug/metabolite transporter (DMT)-like permease